MSGPSDAEVKKAVEDAFSRIDLGSLIHKTFSRENGFFVKDGLLYRDIGHDFFPIEVPEGEMDENKIREALDKCADVAKAAGATKSERLDEKWRAVKFDVSNYDHARQLNHVLYLALDGHTLLGQNKTEKAHRHLGWVQGALWGLGLVSIEELMNMNRPDESKKESR